MNQENPNIMEMISPAYNVPLDETLYKELVSIRRTMVDLEKTKTDANPVPEGSAKVLDQIVGLEAQACTFPSLMFYCEETAHAYMLNDKMEEALQYAAAALTCAQILQRETAQAKLMELLFKIAIFAKDFKMAMNFLEQKKEIEPLDSDLQEAYESMEALLENDLAPKPLLQIPSGELPVADVMMQILQRGPVEIAARLIRRAGGMPLDKARGEAAKLSEAQLNTMFGKPAE